MAKITKWFPQSVYVEDFLLREDYVQKIKSHIENDKTMDSGVDIDWYCSTLTSAHKRTLTEEDIFIELINVVNKHVNIFANALGSNFNYSYQDGWYNISRPGDYQEPHTHQENGSLISGVYYVSAPKNSGNIRFYSPSSSCCTGLKNVTPKDELSWGVVDFEPEPNRLILFRSYLQHGVRPNKSNENRISVAFNFS